MALACKTFWSLECSSFSSTYEKSSSCTLSSWPLSQAAPFITRTLHRSISIACAGREALVSQSQELGASFASRPLQDVIEGSLDVDTHRFPPSDEASGSGFLAESPFNSQVAIAESQKDCSLPSPFVQVSENSTLASLKEDEQAGVQVRDDDDEEEEWMKGFPGAKGALIKPLTEEKLKFFPEDYLDTVTSIDKWDWVTVVPIRMLPKGDRLVLDHNKESVILFWFRERIYALENRSPAAPMFEEGFAKAVISEDGLITCPITGSKFDIRTGAAIEWLPKSSFLEKLFTPVMNDLSIYAVKASPDHIFINKKRLLVGGYYPLAEFTGNRIWTGPDYEEPIIFDDLEFGFTEENELTNGRFAMLGFLTLLILEMTTGEGILKGSGILDFLYKFLPGFPVLRY